MRPFGDRRLWPNPLDDERSVQVDEGVWVEVFEDETPSRELADQLRIEWLEFCDTVDNAMGRKN